MRDINRESYEENHGRIKDDRVTAAFSLEQASGAGCSKLLNGHSKENVVVAEPRLE